MVAKLILCGAMFCPTCGDRMTRGLSEEWQAVFDEVEAGR
jgi:hypothetical protein